MRLFPLIIATLISAAPAFAQEDPFARGIDLVPIKFTPTMSSGLALEGAELEHLKSFQLQAMFDFNVSILALKLGNERLGDLVPFRWNVHLMGAYQVHPRVEISADVPISIQAQNFKLLSDQGFDQKAPNAVGLGAPRLLGRFQILKQSELPIVGLAAILEVRAPIGDQFSFMSDRGFVFAPRLAVERSFGPVRILGNIGWRLRTANGRYLNLLVGQEFAMGGGAIVALPDIKMFKNNSVLGELNIATPAEAPFTFRDAEALKTPFELLFGARTHLKDNWGVQLAVGKGLGAPGYGRELIRFNLSVRYEHFTEPDKDGDGIPDRIDQCVDVPEDKDGYQDQDGCPEPDTDRDSDNDGIPDKIDGCPDQPGPGPLDGCPDRDGDQIPDNVDKCPDQPGPPELQGCPPPEEEEDVVLESERIRINNQILFEFGSNVIDPRSYKLLDDVAKVLKDNPDVGPVIIEGHTDNIGSRAYNIDLSKRRAKAVEDYLVTKGIEKKRLRSDGFGFDKPIAPNDTPLNRAKNRRTEFKLVEEAEKKGEPKPAPKNGNAPPK